MFEGVPLSRPVLLESAYDIESVLRDCCRAELPATVFVPYSRQVAAATFFAVGDTKIHLKSEELANAELPPLAVCCVYFNSQSRANAFLSIVRECRPVPGRPGQIQITVQAPDLLTSMQSRQAFRIPMEGHEDLRVALQVENAVQEVRAKNISLGGMLVDTGGNNHHDWSKGSKLKVVLEFQGARAELAGTVRWAEGDRLGLFFECAMRNGELDPPTELASLVRKIEIDYLRRRAEGEALGDE